MATLTGCWGLAPIERAGLVTLLAVDLAPGGGYTVTADILTPLGLPPPSPTGGGGATPHPVLERSSSAPSVVDAIRHLSDRSHLDLEFTHLQGLIVSEVLARQGLVPLLDDLVRSPDISTTTPWLLVARDGNAAPLLDATTSLTPHPGAALTDTLARAGERTPYPAQHVWEFFKQVRLVGDEPATAGITLDLSKGAGRDAGFRLDGEALFTGGRLTGWLDGGAALGLVVATGRTRQQTLFVPAGTDGYTLEFLGGRRTVKVSYGAAGPSVRLEVQVTALVTAAEGVQTNFYRDKSLVDTVKTAAGAVLTGDVLDAVHAAQAAGSDALSLGEYVRTYDPGEWPALRTSWSSVGFPRLAVTPVIQVHISGVGLIWCPVLAGCLGGGR